MVAYTGKTTKIKSALEEHCDSLHRRVDELESYPIEEVKYTDLQEIMLLITKNKSLLEDFYAAVEIEYAASKDRTTALVAKKTTRFPKLVRDVRQIRMATCN